MFFIFQFFRVSALLIEKPVFIDTDPQFGQKTQEISFLAILCLY